MARDDGYLSARESRRISKENRKITAKLEKVRTRRNVPESEYMTEMKNPANAVEFENLHTFFFTDAGTVKSVDSVSFEVPLGKTVGVVGESGCGKSVTSLSLMQLLQRPQGQVVEGSIRLNTGDKVYEITKTPENVMQHLRGNFMSMIFQEPMTSLNPVFRIGDQMDEVTMLHKKSEYPTKEAVKGRTIELLKMVGIANSEGIYNMYPHELSGGMRQRVMIAMALACSPKLIIADEPTTALDVTIQAQILDLLRGLKDKINSSIMLITHDLGVIAEMADYVVVMYSGRVVEAGTAKEIFSSPARSRSSVSTRTSSIRFPARCRTRLTCRITATSATAATSARGVATALIRAKSGSPRHTGSAAISMMRHTWVPGRAKPERKRGNDGKYRREGIDAPRAQRRKYPGSQRPEEILPD